MIYESPARVARTIGDLESCCGPDRPVALARELTKVHEEWWRGTVAAARRWLASGAVLKGEWVIVLGGAPAVSAPDDDELRAALAARIDAGVDRRTAIAEVAEQRAVPKRRVYQLAVALPRGDG